MIVTMIVMYNNVNNLYVANNAVILIGSNPYSIVSLKPLDDDSTAFALPGSPPPRTSTNIHQCQESSPLATHQLINSHCSHSIPTLL